MAVLYGSNNNKEDEKKNQEVQGQAPQITNPGSVGVVGAQGGAPATQTPNARGSSSGRFTNLKSYLNANKGFNQAQGGLGGKVAQNLSQQGQQVQSNVQKAGQTFQQQSAQNLQGARQGATLTQQAVVDPSQFAQNEQNVNQLAQARDAVYQGPKSLLDVQGDQNQAILEAKAREFNANVGQTGTEKGRFNLLRNMFGKPTYSSGQQNLDNLLIQGDKQQLKNIQGSRRAAVDVNKALQSNISQAAQQGQNAIQEAQNIREATRGALNQRVAQEQQDIQKQLQNAKQQQDAAFLAAKEGLAKGELTEDQAKLLNLSEGTRLYKVDPSQYLRKGMEATAETAATKQNYDQIAALKKILADAQSAESSKVLAQYADPTKAESYKNNPAVLLDKDVYENQLEQAGRELEARLAGNVERRGQGEGTARRIEDFMGGIKQDYANKVDAYKNQVGAKLAEIKQMHQYGMIPDDVLASYQNKFNAINAAGDPRQMSGEQFFNTFLRNQGDASLLTGVKPTGGYEGYGMGAADINPSMLELGFQQQDRDKYGYHTGSGSNALDQLAYERSKRDYEQRIIDSEREAAGYNRLLKILKGNANIANENEGSNISLRPNRSV